MQTKITFQVPGKIYIDMTAVPEQDQFGFEMQLLSKMVQMEIDYQLVVYFVMHWRGEILKMMQTPEMHKINLDGSPA